LDGTPLQRSGTAELIELRPDTIYYLIESSD
jgi:hypothetical protein